jgi:agmatine deiminase
MSKIFSTCRLPAEWEPQDGILLAWPHKETDWQAYLAEVTAVYLDLVREIVACESVLIVTPEPDIAINQMIQAGIELSAVQVKKIPTNDTWARDFGPITILRDNQPLLLNFNFNGWGGKFTASEDNQVTERLQASGSFGSTPGKTIDLVLEGGSIECDGQGTLLTTTKCLLNTNRNPQFSKARLEEILAEQLGARRVIWLEHGSLAGDDTDAHIDTLARLCPNDTIIYIRCDDPADEHYADLQAMETQLQRLRTNAGKPYRLIPLPWPQACYDEQKQRLPASYANYLVINDAVLVPTYNDPADQTALAAVAEAYPARKITGIDCRPLIRQHGSLHCLTMQLPKGVLHE